MPQTNDNPSASMMWKAIIIAIVLCALVLPFAMKGKGGAAPAAAGEETEARILPVARFELQSAKAGGGAQDPNAVYNTVCAGCHGTGAAGAPKRGDKAAWAPRVARGIDALVKSAVAGKGAMPPKGGAAHLGDAELKAVIELMVK